MLTYVSIRHVSTHTPHPGYWPTRRDRAAHPVYHKTQAACAPCRRMDRRRGRPALLYLEMQILPTQAHTENL